MVTCINLNLKVLFFRAAGRKAAVRQLIASSSGWSAARHEALGFVWCGFQFICARCTVLLLLTAATQWMGCPRNVPLCKVVQHCKLCPVVLAAVHAAAVMQNIQSVFCKMGCDCLLSFAVSVHPASALLFEGRPCLFVHVPCGALRVCAVAVLSVLGLVHVQ